MAMDNFYYNEQIKSYMIQFMAIFSGLKVSFGKDENNNDQLVPVPIQYGYKDRVVAHIINNNTQNKMIRLPMMSAMLMNIDPAPESRKGIGNVRRTSYVPRAGVIPDDITTVEQLMPVPYRARTELAIYASNQEQMFQILEQIFLVFDPLVQIQSTDGLFDWTKLTTVELDGIHSEANYPPGTDRRIIVWTLSFNFVVYLSAPAELKKNFIKEIGVRLGIINGTLDPATVVDQFDAESLDYEAWFTLSNEGEI